MINAKIAVCIPSIGMCRIEFTMGLANLISFIAGNRLSPDSSLESMCFTIHSSGILHNRNRLVQQAKAWGATHVMFLDEDMIFPPSALHMLYRRHQPWVAANYLKRAGPPYSWTAVEYGNKERIVTHPDSLGIERANYTGFGVSLLSMEIFDAVPKPWFHNDYLPEGEGTEDHYTTEDFYFAEKVRAAGFSIWVDHDVSKFVKHIGTRTFGPEDWESRPRNVVDLKKVA
jgi:hypothetical protein